jgi:hypothetical protein
MGTKVDECIERSTSDRILAVKSYTRNHVITCPTVGLDFEMCKERLYIEVGFCLNHVWKPSSYVWHYS